MNACSFEVIHKFSYLGATLSTNNDEVNQIQSILATGMETTLFSRYKSPKVHTGKLNFSCIKRLSEHDGIVRIRELIFNRAILQHAGWTSLS